jgi:hypothetical protein
MTALIATMNYKRLEINCPAGFGRVGRKILQEQMVTVPMSIDDRAGKPQNFSIRRNWIAVRLAPTDFNSFSAP